MATNSLHPSYAGRITPQPQAAEDLLPRPVISAVYVRALTMADRACCCTAKPAVMAIMHATQDRPHRTDLLLCMHHYRASRHSLASAGATVVDARGCIVTDADRWTLTV